jgi:anti-sigma-K factor RskA
MAVSIWQRDRQEGELVVVGLPVLSPDQTYQLWITRPRETVGESAAVFAVDPASGKARVPFQVGRPVPTGAAFTVTVERRGGATTIGGPVVLSGQ